MNEKEKLYPSPLPDGEAPADNAAFVSACISVASDRAAALGWRLGKSVLTRSDIWGLVWRVDFKAKDHRENSPHVSRMILWGTADGVVLGTATIFGQKPLVE